MPPRQQKLEQLQFDAGDAKNDLANVRSPFRESETMELKSLAPAVDHEGFSIPPHAMSGSPPDSAARDSDSDDDVQRSRLRSIRIRDANDSQPVAPESVSVDFLNSAEIRRSARDAWAAPPSTSQASVSATNTFEESDDWTSGSGSPKRVVRVIDVPLCERVVPPSVDAVMTNKLKAYLRADKIRIWLLPYSDERGDGHIPSDLINNYASRLGADQSTLAACIERLRILTFNRKVRRLAAEGITVAHIETEVVEPDRTNDAKDQSAAAAHGASKQGRPGYEQVAGESVYAIATSDPAHDGEASRAGSRVSQPVYAVANAVPTRRYEDLVNEYSDITAEDFGLPSEADSDAAPASAPPAVPLSPRPAVPPATVLDLSSSVLHMAEPPLMQFNNFGNESNLSAGYLELAAPPEEGPNPSDHYAVDLGPADALYTDNGEGYMYDTPSFVPEFNDLANFTLNDGQPAPVLNAFDAPPPPPASVAVSIPSDTRSAPPAVASPPAIFIAEAPPASAPSSAATSLRTAPTSSSSAPPTAPRPAVRDARASAMEVNMAAGGDSTCEGFVPQLFRPKICSLCFRERSLHKGM